MPVDSIALAPLQIVVVIASPDGLFSTKIMPTLRRSCTSAGCHASPEFIDLRSFPFAAEGSYAMDDIRARLGENPDSHTVQLAVVKVLIDAMQSLYMPPAPTAAIDESGIAAFETWHDQNLEQSPTPFNGRFHAVGKDVDEKERCTCHGDIINGSFKCKIERKDCKDVATATYQVTSAEGVVAYEGGVDGAEFLQLETWLIQLN